MKISKGVTQEADGSWWYQTPKGQRHLVHVRECPTCGDSFVGTTGKVNPYCSPGCNFRPCIRCGDLFAARSNRSRYCSLACRVGPATCEECGKSFQASRHTAMRFCSRQCWGDARLPIGATRVNADGYIRVKVPHGESKSRGWRNRWMPQHRWVMQQMLGRPLDPAEQVHHKNGDRADNRPENLELWRKKSQVPGVRASDYHCPGCSCS